MWLVQGHRAIEQLGFGGLVQESFTRILQSLDFHVLTQLKYQCSPTTQFLCLGFSGQKWIAFHPLRLWIGSSLRTASHSRLNPGTHGDGKERATDKPWLTQMNTHRPTCLCSASFQSLVAGVRRKDWGGPWAEKHDVPGKDVWEWMTAFGKTGGWPFLVTHPQRLFWERMKLLHSGDLGIPETGYRGCRSENGKYHLSSSEKALWSLDILPSCSGPLLSLPPSCGWAPTTQTTCFCSWCTAVGNGGKWV